MAKDKKTRDALKVSDEEIHASQLDPGEIAVVSAFDDDGGGSYEDSSGGLCTGGTLCEGPYCEKGYSSKAMVAR